MTDWQVGMEAVCIDGYENGGPELHGIYTVIRVSLIERGERVRNIDNNSLHVSRRDAVALSFREFSHDLYFLAEGFRPVQKRKTDISVFTALLNTVKEPEKELAR